MFNLNLRQSARSAGKKKIRTVTESHRGDEEVHRVRLVWIKPPLGGLGVKNQNK